MKRLVGLILALLSVCILITGCKAKINEDEGCKWSAWTCTEEAKIGKKTTFESVCEECSKKRTYRTRASKGLEYAENTDGTLTVTGIGSCDDEFLYIASEHNGKKVTAIGENAFDGARGIKYIYVSGGIEKIMPHAFIACSDLLCVTLAQGVKEIGMYAFFECVSMYDVALPEGITAINDYTFAGCYALRNIDLPSTTSHIGTGAFAGCKSIKEFVLPRGVTTLSQHMLDACFALERVDISSAQGVLPESIFAACESLKSVRIPEGIHTIDTKAFIGCSALESVYIPAGVTTIVSRDGESPFYMCDPEILTVKCEAGNEGANWEEGYDVCNYIEYDDTTKPIEAVRIKFEFGQKG